MGPVCSPELIADSRMTCVGRRSPDLLSGRRTHGPLRPLWPSDCDKRVLLNGGRYRSMSWKTVQRVQWIVH